MSANDEAGFVYLRRHLVGDCIEALNVGDGGAAILTLGSGRQLVLRPVILAERAAIISELIDATARGIRDGVD